jgi:hypothetical protein
VSDSHQIRAGVLSGTHQIPHRLHVGLGHRDRGDLTQPQQAGQMRGVADVGLDPIPARTDQLRRRCDYAVDLGSGQGSREPEPRRPGFIGHSHRATQLVQSGQDLAVIGTQSCPLDATCFFIECMRNHRKRMHVQSHTRTVETHRSPPDLQLWLYWCECSLVTGNPRPIAAPRPSASSRPHTV